jgi:hypothetical protein
LRVRDHARLAAQHASDRVKREQRLMRRSLSASFPYAYRIKSFPDVFRTHSTATRQNGWPIGVPIRRGR